jgi:hypothetical protein
MDDINTIFNDDNIQNMNITNIVEDENEYEYSTSNLKDINNKNVRYLNIINYLGLNPNINYPISIIINGIVELHTHEYKVTTSYAGKIQFFIFNSCKISQEIKKNLFDYMKEKYSFYEINRAVKRAYHYYNLDNVINKISVNTTKKQESIVLGFNYNNPRWVPLNSYEIE